MKKQQYNSNLSIKSRNARSGVIKDNYYCIIFGYYQSFSPLVHVVICICIKPTNLERTLKNSHFSQDFMIMSKKFFFIIMIIPWPGTGMPGHTVCYNLLRTFENAFYSELAVLDLKKSHRRLHQTGRSTQRNYV